MTITIVWNTDYAHKMHEHKGNWGKFTQDDAGAGAKWAEEHLQKDRNELAKFIAGAFGKISGMK